MAIHIQRREFIFTLGGAAAAWPLAVGAQQPAMPVIGFLNGASAQEYVPMVAEFREGLRQTGLIDGQNVAIEFRWAENSRDRLPALASELVRSQPTVIVAGGGSLSIAQRATSTIPIVGPFGGDPVKLGIVASLNRPGGNVTGVAVLTSELEVKRLELLHELFPKAALFGVLLDANFSDAAGQLRQVEATARSIGQQIRILQVSGDSDIESAFAALAEAHATALAVAGSPLFLSKRHQIVALAARHAIATIYENRETVAIGGLMSYGPSIPGIYRQLGIYAGRILKGEKPADLPMLQPSKFEMSINLKTAKTLGLNVPTSILLRADEVIE